MSLAERLLEVKRKSQAHHIAQQVVDHVYHIDELMDLFFSEDWVMCQKASWPVTMVADKNPGLLIPYLERMLAHLDKAQHNALIRNTIRTWQVMKIPEEFEGPIYDKP